MKRNATQTLAACALLALAVGSLHAQVFRIVGPDGRVTYSDKPPQEPAKVTSAAAPSRNSAEANGALPFALRSVVGRYPVTIYTGSTCGPCASGRAFLSSRGIPFSERTISTEEDAAALQRLAGSNSLPVLTIGSQQLKGFSDLEWGQFLDAAGYPATSQLPTTYRRPPATPLVAAQRPPDGSTAAQSQDGTSSAPIPAAAPAPAPANPTGITF